MNPSLTPEENFRIFNAVPVCQLEQLLDVSGKVEELQDCEANINEGLCQYPAEDFLSEVISDLHALAKRIRGDNRADLMHVIEKLDDIAQTTFNAADYGRSELRKVLKAMK